MLDRFERDFREYLEHNFRISDRALNRSLAEALDHSAAREYSRAEAAQLRSQSLLQRVQRIRHFSESVAEDLARWRAELADLGLSGPTEFKLELGVEASAQPAGPDPRLAPYAYLFDERPQVNKIREALGDVRRFKLDPEQPDFLLDSLHGTKIVARSLKRVWGVSSIGGLLGLTEGQILDAGVKPQYYLAALVALVNKGIEPIDEPEDGRIEGSAASSPRNQDKDANDVLYEQAMEAVRQFNRGSASLLQRRLGIGYARAARLVDQLARGGVLGPDRGSKARDVISLPPKLLVPLSSRSIRISQRAAFKERIAGLSQSEQGSKVLILMTAMGSLTHFSLDQARLDEPLDNVKGGHGALFKKLNRNKVVTIGDLLKLKIEDILSLRNVGVKRVITLLENLVETGIYPSITDVLSDVKNPAGVSEGFQMDRRVGRNLRQITTEFADTMNSLYLGGLDDSYSINQLVEQDGMGFIVNQEWSKTLRESETPGQAKDFIAGLMVANRHGVSDVGRIRRGMLKLLNQRGMGSAEVRAVFERAFRKIEDSSHG